MHAAESWVAYIEVGLGTRVPLWNNSEDAYLKVLGIKASCFNSAGAITDTFYLQPVKDPHWPDLPSEGVVLNTDQFNAPDVPRANGFQSIYLP